MQRWVIAILILFGFGISAGISQDKAKPVTVEYFGQSFFIVTSSKGIRIAFDPHTIPAYYPSGTIPLQKADIVCLSHNHPDHIRTEVFEKVKGKELKILKGLKNMTARSDWSAINETIGDVKVRNVGVYHERQ